MLSNMLLDDIMALPILNLKATLKMLVLAPAASALSFVITQILYADAVAAGALTGAAPYALIVAGVVFAIVVATGIDDMLS